MEALGWEVAKLFYMYFCIIQISGLFTIHLKCQSVKQEVDTIDAELVNARITIESL